MNEDEEQEQKEVEIRTSLVLPLGRYRQLSINRAVHGCTYKELLNALIELYLNDEEVQEKVFTLLNSQKERR